MFANAKRSIGAGAVLLLAVIAALVSTPGSRLQASTLVWQDLFGGRLLLGAGTMGLDTAVDSQGYLYVTGLTTHTLPGQTLLGERDAFLRKYDAATGALVWTRQFGGAAPDEGHGVAVSGADVYVAGHIDGRMFLRKFSGDGTELWTWMLSEEFGPSRGYSVAVDAAGFAYVAGEGSEQGSPRAVLAKVNASGGSDWTTFALAGTGSARIALTSVALTATGRVVIGGFAEGLVQSGSGSVAGSYSGGRDAFVVQMDGGSRTWDWGVQFGTADRDEVTSVVTDSDASVVVVGMIDSPPVGGGFRTTQGGGFIRKYDSSGLLSWSRDLVDAGNVRRTFCDAAINPLTHSVNVVGMTEDKNYPSRDLQCRSVRYTSGNPVSFEDENGAPIVNGVFVDSFDAAGTEIAWDRFGLSEPEQFSIRTAFGVAQFGDSAIVVGNTQTFWTSGSAVLYENNYGFAARRHEIPVGIPEVHFATTHVTVIAGQTATFTGTYHNPNGGPVTFSPAAGVVTTSGGASGTWSWSIPTSTPGTVNYGLLLSVGDFWQTQPSVTVTATPPVAPIVHPATNAVVVVAGQTATMTGTYDDPNGVTPTLSASVGAFTQSGAESGTWSWSFPTTSTADTQAVIITAIDSYGVPSESGFQLTVLSHAPPTLSVIDSTVAVTPGQTATNSGTYLNAHGLTPTLIASEGAIVQSGGATGTWSWSRPTDPSYTGGTITISASDGGPEGTVSFQVVAQTSATSLTSSANPSIVGAPVTLAATVTSTAGGAPPTGAVQFVVDGADVGGPVTLTGGAASIGAPALAVGSHAVAAVYSGDAAHGPSTGLLTQRVVSTSLAQAGPWRRQFGTVNGDQAFDVAGDAGGNVFVAGSSNGEAFLRKYDVAGTELWTETFGFPGGMTNHAVAVDDARGLIYVVGELGAAGARDVIVIQYRAIGGWNWTYRFGSDADDIAYGVTVDAQGDVYIAGSTYGQLPGQIARGGVDAFVVRMDSSRNVVWTRQFGTNTTDELFGVAVDGAGRVAVTGYTGGALLGQTLQGFDDVLVAQLSRDGALLWLQQYGGGLFERGQGVATDAAGNVLVAGSTSHGLPGQPTFGGPDAFVQKYNALGVEQWTREFGTSSGDFANDVAVDAAGNVVVTGTGNNRLFVQRFLGDGTPGTAQQLDVFAVGHAVAVDAAGHLNVAGTVIGALSGQTSAGGQDAFVMHLVDESGPTITEQPTSQTAIVGDVVTFSAAASGTPAPVVRWQVSTDGGATFSDIPGAAASTYSLTTTLADDGHQYRAVFTSSAGTAASDAATLSVHGATIALAANAPAVIVTAGQLASNGGSYSNPTGLTPTLTASVGTVTVVNGTWSWSMATTDPLPEQTVTISAGDITGANGTTAFQFTVLADQTGPVITTPGEITVESGAGGAVAVFSVSAVDAVDGTVPVTCSSASGAIYPLGATLVTCTAADVVGNETEASFTIRVVDTTAPAFTILGWDADSVFDGSPVTVQVQASDAVGVQWVDVGSVHASLVSGSPQSGVWEAVDVPTAVGFETGFVAWGEDAAGNMSFHEVFADGDGIAATIDRGMDVDVDQAWEFSHDFNKDDEFTRGTIEDRGAFRVFIEDVTGTPSVRARVEGSRLPAAAARVKPCFPGTPKEVRLDAGGEQAIWTCAAGGTITITAEVARPTIDIFKAGCAQGACAMNFLAALSQGDSLTTGSPFSAGPDNTTPIVVTILNGSGTAFGSFSLDPGESADVASAVGGNGEEQMVLTTLEGEVEFTVSGQTVTVGEDDPPAVVSQDHAAPVIAAPANVTAEATSAAGAVVTFALPAASDDTDPAPSVTAMPASGSAFPIGNTIVTVIATDVAGNSASATFVVTVQDTTAPALTVPAPIVAEAVVSDGVAVTFAATATDAVSEPSVACTPESGTTFPVGTTTVTCTATDAAGNVATATFTVEITDAPTPGMMHGDGRIMAGPVRYGFRLAVLALTDGRSWGLFTLDVCEPEPPRRGRRNERHDRRGDGRDRRDDDGRGSCVGGGDRFVARTVTSARFGDDASVEPGRGRSQRHLPDTVLFAGIGTWRDTPGFRYEVRAIDGGEPGKTRDAFAVTITTPDGATTVAAAQGTLTSGNVQSAPAFKGWRGWSTR